MQMSSYRSLLPVLARVSSTAYVSSARLLSRFAHRGCWCGNIHLPRPRPAVLQRTSARDRFTVNGSFYRLLNDGQTLPLSVAGSMQASARRGEPGDVAMTDSGAEGYAL